MTYHKPHILVMMATHNGMLWLEEQVESILGQEGVDITLCVSDDCSTDGTYARLQQYTQMDERIILLEKTTPMGSAGRNFYRIIREVDVATADFFAYADQDDIWELGKLDMQVELMRQHQADGVSSNVEAFWPDGRHKLIDKAQSQRRLDYLFESAGPGCTFLMTPWLMTRLQESLADPAGLAASVSLHDWLAYAVCRTLGRKWHIDQTATVRYRQHANNVLGANVGIKTRLARIMKLRTGWYRQEIMKISSFCAQVSGNPAAANIKSSLEAGQYKGLLPYISEARRRRLDRIFLMALVICGWI